MLCRACSFLTYMNDLRHRHHPLLLILILSQYPPLSPFSMRVADFCWLTQGTPCLRSLEHTKSFPWKWKTAAAAAKSLQSCPTLCDPIDGSPPRSPLPGNSPGKNTAVGCHFLLQCMKVKSESEVAQSCPTLSDPMDCSLPGSSVPGIFQARALEWG